MSNVHPLRAMVTLHTFSPEAKRVYGETPAEGRVAMLTVTSNKCRFCQREWTPPKGVNANESYCNACSEERQRRAKEVFGDDGKVERLVGKYLIRVPNESA